MSLFFSGQECYRKLIMLETHSITSKYFGVSGYKLGDGETRWVARRTINYQEVYGGTFKVEEDAAKASDDLVLDHLNNGGQCKRVKLNFRSRKLSDLDKKTRNRILILGETRLQQSTSFSFTAKIYMNIFTTKMDM